MAQAGRRQGRGRADRGLRRRVRRFPPAGQEGRRLALGLRCRGRRRPRVLGRRRPQGLESGHQAAVPVH
ncbi:hypothetical protein SGPA1_30140 [Streptomyces misionensis JCM 4497]